MYSPVANFLDASRGGVIHPLVGFLPRHRLIAETSPIYLMMLVEGWPDPFVDHNGVASGLVVQP